MNELCPNSAYLDNIHADMKFLSDFHVIDVSFKIFNHLWLLEIRWDVLFELIIWNFDSGFFRSIYP